MRQQGRLNSAGNCYTTAYSTVRERINAILAFEIMLFALIFAAGFHFLNRRNTLRLVLFQRESEDLRALNQRLQREIAERKKVKKICKLRNKVWRKVEIGGLGRNVGRVLHELNQPLAAMKTYCRRRIIVAPKRPDEAFRRVFPY